MSDPRFADRRIDAQYRLPEEYSNTIGAAAAGCEISQPGSPGRMDRTKLIEPGNVEQFPDL
jgi:hypothetical protein